MPTSRPVRISAKLGEILDCYSDVDDLKTEMVEWLDSIPDSLSSSDKASQIEDAANTPELGHSALEDACGTIKSILEKKAPLILERDVSYIEHKMYKGYNMPRWVRLANPVAAIENAASVIEDMLPIEGLDENDIDTIKYSLEEIDDAVSDLNGVEFPSMFG